jgi:type I restriction enzyme S subunit
MVTLNDVCSIITDGTHQTPEYATKGFMFLSSKNVTTGKIDWENIKYIPEGLHNQLYARIAPQCGDVLLAKNGTTGVAAVVDKDYVFDIYVSLALLRPKDLILSEYLLYSINNPITKRKFNKELKGIGVPNLHLKNIRETTIPFPPLETQKEIAKILESAADLLAMRKQQLAELDNLIKSNFYEMFGDPFENPKGWNKCNLSDLAIIIMGQSPQGNSYNEKGEGTPLLNGPTEFGNKYPIEKQWTLEPTKMCQKEDILFCVRGATAGRMNISDKEYCIGRGLAAIRPRESNMQSFIYLYLNMMYSFFQSTSNGSTFINISKNQLFDIPFLQVDTDIQEKFSRIVLTIEEQKALVKKAIDETQYLFDSLMSEYFE